MNYSSGENSGFSFLGNKRVKSSFLQESDKCNLFVYGYASKLYRDDEKAEELDQGKHLIPWMGDESLKIDRYDVRGCLSDLTQFEKDFDNPMCDEDQQMEEMCDAERYYSLLSEKEEEESYKEEEAKRQDESLSKEYHQVPFVYDSDSSLPGDNIEHNSGVGREVCHYNDTDIDTDSTPSSMSETTSTNNMNEIIRKTAECVAKNGRQMEIIIKARQANNKKFDFLNRNNEFNPFYECVLKECQNRQTQKEDELGSDNEEKNRHLKSDIISSSLVELAPGKCKTEPQNCPYSLIVESIQNSKKKCN